MTTTERVFKKETLTPLGAPFKGKLKLKPSWTQYASDYEVNRDAKDVDLDTLDPEQPHAFTFVRERQKDNNEGSKDFHWYWGIWAIADAAEALEPQETLAVTPVETKDVPVAVTAAAARPIDPVDHIATPTLHPAADKYGGAGLTFSEWHISRRTALMQAVEYSKYAELGSDAIGKSIVLTTANEMFAWLRGVPQNSPESPVQEAE